MRLFFCTLAVLTVGLCAPAFAAPEVGKPAPDFTATAIDGSTVTLSAYKGKPVVLEWTNHECPFVVKHYGSGNMQKTQKAAVEGGAVWLSIVSSAPGKEGHVTPEEASKIVADSGAPVTAKILDEKGDIGKLYGAKTTPHMFVIDKDGTLVYAGAIDDKPSTDPKTVEGARNYVTAALEDLAAGRPVQTAQTEAYGCGVKY
jgi:peroxiredoxin